MGGRSVEDVIQKHYRRLAAQYDDFLYYSPDFVRALTAKMIDKLQLRADDVLVDLGCGTGMYSVDILDQISLKNPVIGVDPFPEMLAGIPDGAAIMPIADDGLEFTRKPYAYDKVLIKETIHHIDRRDELFANLYRRLPDDGILLLVHVPPDVQYPLFDNALERAKRWHADPNELVGQLEASGYEVERDALDYTHRIPKDLYFRMVGSCYMSVLTSFDESELREGLAEMEQRYADREILEFVDHFDYLTATKAEVSLP